MELLVAFLISFGVVDAKTTDVNSITQEEAKVLIERSNLEKEAIIWDAEGDDF